MNEKEKPNQHRLSETEVSLIYLVHFVAMLTVGLWAASVLNPPTQKERDEVHADYCMGLSVPDCLSK